MEVIKNIFKNYDFNVENINVDKHIFKEISTQNISKKIFYDNDIDVNIIKILNKKEKMIVNLDDYEIIAENFDDERFSSYYFIDRKLLFINPHFKEIISKNNKKYFTFPIVIEKDNDNKSSHIILIIIDTFNKIVWIFDPNFAEYHYYSIGQFIIDKFLDNYNLKIIEKKLKNFYFINNISFHENDRGICNGICYFFAELLNKTDLPFEKIIELIDEIDVIDLKLLILKFNDIKK